MTLIIAILAIAACTTGLSAIVGGLGSAHLNTVGRLSSTGCALAFLLGTFGCIYRKAFGWWIVTIMLWFEIASAPVVLARTFVNSRADIPASGLVWLSVIAIVKCLFFLWIFLGYWLAKKTEFRPRAAA